MGDQNVPKVDTPPKESDTTSTKVEINDDEGLEARYVNTILQGGDMSTFSQKDLQKLLMIQTKSKLESQKRAKVAEEEMKTAKEEASRVLREKEAAFLKTMTTDLKGTPLDENKKKDIEKEISPFLSPYQNGSMGDIKAATSFLNRVMAYGESMSQAATEAERKYTEMVSKVSNASNEYAIRDLRNALNGQNSGAKSVEDRFKTLPPVIPNNANKPPQAIPTSGKRKADGSEDGELFNELKRRLMEAPTIGKSDHS
jgi:hypothetical protein